MLYVIAIGGNALGKGEVLRKLSEEIIRLYRRGNQIVITHGNGPQVGELALHEKKSLAVLTEETEVHIGERIERALSSAAKRKKISAIIVLTRVLVDNNDREFKNPSKPIGKFYSEKEVAQFKNKGFVIKHLLEGYRRVVPSPRPKQILRLSRIKQLLKQGNIVIAAGGGGIAVIKEKGGFRYADAVIDKDLASALLAQKLKADRLFILTNVDGVFTGFETKKERMLRRAGVSQLKNYIEQGQFEAGSMLPKVIACMDFVKKTGNYAVIGNLNKVYDVFKLKGVTVIAR